MVISATPIRVASSHRSTGAGPVVAVFFFHGLLAFSHGSTGAGSVVARRLREYPGGTAGTA